MGQAVGEGVVGRSGRGQGHAYVQRERSGATATRQRIIHGPNLKNDPVARRDRYASIGCRGAWISAWTSVPVSVPMLKMKFTFWALPEK